MKLLKSTLKLWQEIVFTLPVGLCLFVMSKHAILQHSMDGWDVLCLSFLSVSFVGLIGLFVWPNRKLAIAIAPLLFLFSLFWVFVSYAMPKDNPYNDLRIVILLVGLFLVFAAITFLTKYYKNSAKGALVS